MGGRPAPRPPVATSGNCCKLLSSNGERLAAEAAARKKWCRCGAPGLRPRRKLDVQRVMVCWYIAAPCMHCLGRAVAPAGQQPWPPALHTDRKCHHPTPCSSLHDFTLYSLLILLIFRSVDPL